MRIGIAGYGNMGSAFAKALSEKVGKENVVVYDVQKEKVELALKDGFAVAKDLYFLTDQSDVIILAVKPRDIRGVLEEIKERIGDRVLVSIAAGIEIGYIEGIVGRKKIVRLMPNINVLVGRGTIAVVRNSEVGDEEYEDLKEILSACGSLHEIPESLFDSFTALAGSSPAFIFEFIDALALAGVREGFSYEKALEIVLDTILGSAQLIKERGGNPNEWITKVTSPGGTTIEGIAYLERKGFRGTVIRCVERTSEKAKKLKG